MEQSIKIVFILFVLMAGFQGAICQFHDKYWIGVEVDTSGTYEPTIMGFDGDSISYQVRPTADDISLQEAVAMSDLAGQLKFYTNGNVVVSWDGYIMQGGKGFNEGSADSDFNNPSYGDTMANNSYVPYTYQLIPDSYEEGIYYMLHSFTTVEELWLGPVLAAPKMQISKIDMTANDGRGKVVYKNRYLNEELMGAAFAVVQHGNGYDWWLVQRSPEGLHFRSTLLHRDTALLTVESSIQGLGSDWFEYFDLANSAQNLLEVSPDGSMLLDNYGVGHAKLMSFDRCSGGVSLIDTFSLGIVPLVVYENQLVHPTVNGFAFSPSGRYLYGVGWAGFAQFDLWAADILGSKVLLGGVPWDMDDLQNILVGYPGGYGPFCLGPDGKLYSLYETTHNVIEHPDEPGEASGICVAADNPPSCLGPNVPYYLFSTPHPNYRLGALTGSGCDTILSSTGPPLTGSGYGVTASPSVASGQVEVSITLPAYGSSSAEVQVVDMLGRVLHRHRFPPYAYLHTLEVSGWPAGLYNVVLLDKGRARAAARLVVAR